MTTYLLARVVRLILVWVGITLATFCLLRLTGDPARLILGELASSEAVREFQRLHGLDRPLPAQYLAFVGGILVGDFGRSLRFEQPILPIILERLPATLELAGGSLALSVLIGVPLGIAAALRRDRPVDYVARGLVVVAQGIPNFLLAILHDPVLRRVPPVAADRAGAAPGRTWSCPRSSSASSCSPSPCGSPGPRCST